MSEKINKEDLKIVVQISQYINGQFMRGSKAHTIYGCHATDVIVLLEFLREKYKKNGKSKYVIRMQISEHQRKRGKYRKQRGGCITLYGVLIKDIFKEVGVLLDNMNELVDRDYESQIHGGVWCLCRQLAGNSRVLEVSSNPSKLFAIKEKYKYVTYVLNPEGKLVYKREVVEEV